MTTDLVTMDLSQIVVEKGYIKFDDYERIRQEALKLAQNIEQVEVNEENVQFSKKMLAAVNKRLKEMDTKRIAVKKEMLKPYENFESQVKEITAIVKHAEILVREQVRNLEEKERDEKRLLIKEIFNKRIKQYDFGEWFTFDMFLQSKHLNKTTSMTVVESDMVEWLEKIHADLAAIELLPNKLDVFTEYINVRDLSKAIHIVKQREDVKKEVEKVVKPKPKNTVEKWCITVNERDALTLEMFMKHMKINYKIEKVEL